MLKIQEVKHELQLHVRAWKVFRHDSFVSLGCNEGKTNIKVKCG